MLLNSKNTQFMSKVWQKTNVTGLNITYFLSALPGQRKTSLLPLLGAQHHIAGGSTIIFTYNLGSVCLVPPN
jgi:hypothetical protein